MEINKNLIICFLMVCLMFLMSAYFPAVIIRDALTGDFATVNSQGRLDVVQHSHDDSSILHFHKDGITDIERFILIDIDNTINWTHTNTNYSHLEFLDLQVDASTTPAAAYSINLLFVEDVSPTNATSILLWHTAGTKQTALQKEIFQDWYPNGPKANSNFVTSHDKDRNNTMYNSTALYFSTVNSTLLSSNLGSGDLVLEVIVTAGNIDVSSLVAYHSHN